MAAPSVVQSVGKTASSNGTTLQLTGLSTTAGNLYVVSVACRANSTVVSSVTDSAGNTWVRRVARSTGVANDTEIWSTSDLSPAAITSVTVTTGSSVNRSFRFIEISGANNPNPGAGYNNSAAANTSLTTNASQGGVWPATCLALAAAGVAYNDQTVFGTTQAFTAGAPDAILPSQSTADFSNVGGSEILLQTAYRALASAAAQTYTDTLTVSNGWAACIWLIQPAASPTITQSVPKTIAATANTAQLTGLSTTAGRLFAVAVGMRNTGGVSSVSDSAGNTWARLVEAHGTNSNAAEIWTTTNASPAAITSVTVNTVNTCGFAFRFIEIANANNASAGDVTAGSAAKNANLSTGATGTPTYAGDLALAVCYAGSNNASEFGTAQAFTSSAAVWEDVLGGANGSLSDTDLSNIASNQAEIQCAYLLGVSAAQTYSTTMVTSLDAWAAVVALIRAAPVAAALPLEPLSVNQAVKRASYY